MMKKLLITGLALTLSACGFTPMHATPEIGESGALRNLSVEVVKPKRVGQQEAGYFVEQHLRDRLGNNIGEHTLKITPRTQRRPYGLTSDDLATRYDMIVNVDYQLIENKSGNVLDRGRVTSTSTFGSARDPYARISSEKNAAEQASRDAADRVLVRVAAYYKDPERRAVAQAAAEAERTAKRDDGIETVDP
ncbi:MAG: hypothetical protein HKN36_12690 [Hellea sp.]|nr:hypothetical protein [Hellea sp.]